MRLALVAVGLLAVLYGCRGKPRPVYEWEPTVTTTSGDAPPEEAPAANVPPANAPPTTVPSRPSKWLRGEKQ